MTARVRSVDGTAAIVAGWAIVFVARWGMAADAPAIALEEMQKEALLHNPGLTAIWESAEAAAARPAREGALPNPMVTLSAEDRASDFRVGGADMITIGAEQGLPWFGKRSLRRRMAEADAASARLAFESARLDLRQKITETAYRLEAARKTSELIQGEIGLLEQMEKVITARYENGAAGQQDVTKVQAETTMLRQRLIDAQSRETSLKARLNTHMGRAADAELGAMALPPEPVWPQPNLSNWFARAEAENPDLGKARVAASRARLEAGFVRRDVFPDVKIMAEVTRMREDDETRVMLGVGVDLPLQVPAIRAGVREADHRVRASEAERETVRRETAYMIQDVASCCAAAWQNLELLRTRLVPEAKARYRASEAAYSAGKADFLDLLESERFLLNVRTMQVMTEAEVATAYAELERLLGGAPTADVRGRVNP